MCHTEVRMCNVLLLRNFSTSLAHARLPAGQLCIGGSGCSSATLFASANGEGWTEFWKKLILEVESGKYGAERKLQNLWEIFSRKANIHSRLVSISISIYFNNLTNNYQTFDHWSSNHSYCRKINTKLNFLLLWESSHQTKFTQSVKERQSHHSTCPF